MKLVKITILSIVIIIVGIISISYVTTESNMIEEIEENPSEQISQLIEWDSDNLFKVLVDPKDIRIIDGESIPESIIWIKIRIKRNL